jgi:hypothetical protein
MAVVNASTTTAPPASRTVKYPVYATKRALLADLEDAVGAETVKVAYIMQRLSDTDTSTWADVGSYIT